MLEQKIPTPEELAVQDRKTVLRIETMETIQSLAAEFELGRSVDEVAQDA